MRWEPLISISVLGFLLGGCTMPVDETDPVATAQWPIYGGQKANQSQIYSTVGFFADFRNANGQQEGGSCTGTVISPTLIVTAAHCVTNMDDDTVGSVTDFFYGSLDLEQGTKIPVESIVKHAGYSAATTGAPQLGADNDIALLILSSAITTLPSAPILPLAQFDANISQGTNLTISGFGTTPTGNDSPIELYIAETPFQQRNDTEFIAGGTGHPDTCSGDSGGPVYLVVGSTRYVIGATSRAAANSGACADVGGIYTLVGGYETWISQNAAGAYQPSQPAAPTTPPASSDDDDDDGGCSMASGPPATGMTIGTWLVLFAVGALARRRRWDR